MYQYKSRAKFTARELLMPEPIHKEVELIGGPLDGRRFVEAQGSPAFINSPTERYCFSGAEYQPKGVEQGILKLAFTGRCYGRG